MDYLIEKFLENLSLKDLFPVVVIIPTLIILWWIIYASLFQTNKDKDGSLSVNTKKEKNYYLTSFALISFFFVIIALPYSIMFKLNRDTVMFFTCLGISVVLSIISGILQINSIETNGIRSPKFKSALSYPSYTYSLVFVCLAIFIFSIAIDFNKFSACKYNINWFSIKTTLIYLIASLFLISRHQKQTQFYSLILLIPIGLIVFPLFNNCTSNCDISDNNEQIQIQLNKLAKEKNSNELLRAIKSMFTNDTFNVENTIALKNYPKRTLHEYLLLLDSIRSLDSIQIMGSLEPNGNDCKFTKLKVKQDIKAELGFYFSQLARSEGKDKLFETLSAYFTEDAIIKRNINHVPIDEITVQHFLFRLRNNAKTYSIRVLDFRIEDGKIKRLKIETNANS